MKRAILLLIFLQLCSPFCLADNNNLPWWSPSAPQVLKELDFSKVTGNADTYNLNSNYRLTKLGEQGRWGTIYILERVNYGSYPKIICAVKLLSSRQNDRISVNEFRLRHWEEIKSTILISNWDIAIKPYGIVRNDQDHFLLLLQYGQNAKGKLIQQDSNTTLLQLNDFAKNLNIMHKRGYAHGDIKLDNLLIMDNKLKLCDWFSLTSNNQIPADKCHYLAARISQKNTNASYYEQQLNTSLQYSIITISNGRQIYWLHPITADRISLGISLLKFIAPAQYQQIKQTPKNFYLYSPLGLTYWPKHKKILQNVKLELIKMAKDIQNKQSMEAQLLYLTIDLINIEHASMIGKYV